MFGNIEIRRIREADADAAVVLWDRMCGEVRDGGPLTGQGRRHIGRMLAITAWHRDAFCLVAVDGDGEVRGFGLGRIDTGGGLLPELVGEIQEVYPAELRTELAHAVIARLRELGARTLRTRVAADEPEEQRFWAGFGFEQDMVLFSRYPE